MAFPHAQPGDVVTLPLGVALPTAQATVLVKTSAIEVLRLVVPSGKEIPTHRAPGPITVQCLEGRVEFTALGKTQQLGAGKFLHLPAGEPHSLRGIDNASLLVTIALSG